MSERALTARQQAILDWLRDEIDRRGMPPTILEIGEECGILSTKVEASPPGRRAASGGAREVAGDRGGRAAGSARRADGPPWVGSRRARFSPWRTTRVATSWTSRWSGRRTFLLRVREPMKNASILDGDSDRPRAGSRADRRHSSGAHRRGGYGEAPEQKAGGIGFSLRTMLTHPSRSTRRKTSDSRQGRECIGARSLTSRSAPSGGI